MSDYPPRRRSWWRALSQACFPLCQARADNGVVVSEDGLIYWSYHKKQALFQRVCLYWACNNRCRSEELGFSWQPALLHSDLELQGKGMIGWSSLSHWFNYLTFQMHTVFFHPMKLDSLSLWQSGVVVVVVRIGWATEGSTKSLFTAQSYTSFLVIQWCQNDHFYILCSCGEFHIDSFIHSFPYLGLSLHSRDESTWPCTSEFADISPHGLALRIGAGKGARNWWRLLPSNPPISQTWFAHPSSQVFHHSPCSTPPSWPHSTLRAPIHSPSSLLASCANLPASIGWGESDGVCGRSMHQQKK